MSRADIHNRKLWREVVYTKLRRKFPNEPSARMRVKANEIVADCVPNCPRFFVEEVISSIEDRITRALTTGED